MLFTSGPKGIHWCVLVRWQHRAVADTYPERTHSPAGSNQAFEPPVPGTFLNESSCVSPLLKTFPDSFDSNELHMRGTRSARTARQIQGSRTAIYPSIPGFLRVAPV